MKKTMKASEFKAKCLQVMDEVAETGEGVVITKNGKPVAELVPAKRFDKPLFGALKGSITYMGDIISPIDEKWDAEEGILLREDDER
jgi:prevent-host-death family protein